MPTKPKPDSLNVDYQEQMRAVGGGITCAARDEALLQDLVDWGYLKRNERKTYEITDEGKEATKGDGAWSPHSDPRIDR